MFIRFTNNSGEIEYLETTGIRIVKEKGGYHILHSQGLTVAKEVKTIEFLGALAINFEME